MIPNSPREWGLPYDDWRPVQKDALERAIAADKQVVFITLPTGGGKSGVGVALAAAHAGKRTVLATKTHQLQQQYLDDFEQIRSIKGRGAYECLLEYDTAAHGQCIDGAYCPHRKKGCPYYDARREANEAPLLVTNYDYLAAAWDGREKAGHPLEARSILIGDEAHLLDESLRSAAGATVSPTMQRWLRKERLAAPEHDALPPWWEWAERVLDSLRWAPRLMQEMLVAGAGYFDQEEYKRIRIALRAHELSGKVKSLLTQGKTLVRRDAMMGSVIIEPVMADLLFNHIRRGVQKVYLMSATLPGPDLTAALLGIHPNTFEVIEAPSTFPAGNRPLIVDTAGINVKWKMGDGDLDRLAARMDHWLALWGDRKVLVHSHAYWLQEAILKRTRHRERFITHGNRGLAGAVAQFKEAGDGAVLISPVAHSGVDLPYDGVRGQLLLKLPTPSLGDPVIKARRELLPRSYDQLIAATWIQSYGRGMRAEDDWCDTVALDGNFRWWLRRNADLVPGWVQEAIIM